MNERQNMVVATAVAGLILVVVYLCPWRIESTGEIRWSPIYQSPMSYVRSYDVEQGSSRIDTIEAHIALGYLILEVLGVVTAAGVLYVFFSDAESDAEDDEEPYQRL